MNRYIPLLFSAVLYLFSPVGWATQVDLNSADVQMLASALSGVGKEKAQAIVDYRHTNGPFQSVDDLTLVKGIGPSTVNKNREKMMVDKVQQ